MTYAQGVVFRRLGAGRLAARLHGSRRAPDMTGNAGSGYTVHPGVDSEIIKDYLRDYCI